MPRRNHHGYRAIPGVSLHAQMRQEQRWGSQWSRTTWLSVVTQIVERTALLVMVKPPNRQDPAPAEVWLVSTPDGPVRVSWRPNTAVISTVLASTHAHNTARYGREVVGIQRDRANHSADNTNRHGRQRAEAEWKRAMRDEDSDA